MVLSGQGSAYLLERLVLEGGRPKTFSRAPCFRTEAVNGRREDNLGEDDSLFDKRGQDMQRRLNKTLEAVDGAKKAAERDGGARNGESDPNDIVYVALNVLVYSGPVTVTSKTHAMKWEKGWVNYMYAEAFISGTKALLAKLEIDLDGSLPRASSDDLGI